MHDYHESCFQKDTRVHLPSQTARDLFYYFQWTGHFLCKKDFSIRRSCLNSYLAIYTQKGEGILHLQGKSYPILPHSLMLLDCTIPQYYHTASCDCWEFQYVHFNGGQCREFFTRTLALYGSPVFSCPLRVKTAFDRMFCSASDSGSEEEHSEVIYRFLISLIREGTQVDTPFLKKIQDYVAENYTSAVNASDMAAFFHMSRTGFAAVFKKATGTSPKRYLDTYRMEAAKHLLDTTSLPIERIAEQCGFRDTSSFTRAFKRLTGISPFAFRRRSRSSEQEQL